MTTAGALPALFEGEVLLPGSPEHDVARAVWNGVVDRRPAYVVRCAGAGDVCSAVRVARELDLPIGVRYAQTCLLRQVRSTWDPDNVFRLNQNIPPV